MQLVILCMLIVEMSTVNFQARRNNIIYLPNVNNWLTRMYMSLWSIGRKDVVVDTDDDDDDDDS
jgi:hypothetical protein